MNTEELIQALKDFKDNFPISDKDKTLITIDEQIKELQNKIANGDSYRTEVVEQPAPAVPTQEPTAEDLLYGTHFENGMEGNVADQPAPTVSVNPANENMRQEFEVRENRIEENNTRLDELNFALEEAEQALVDSRRRFSNTDYDNLDMNSPEYQGQQALLTALDQQITDIRNEITECQDSIARDRTVLDDPKYGKAAFEARMAEDPTLNYQQVFEDERIIEDLQEQYQIESANQAYSQAEMTEPIDRWINQIQSGEYDAATISNEMDEFLKNPYLESLTNDRDAEIADIDRQLPEIEMEIDAIKQRQLSKLNYAVSTFEAGSETMGINGTYDRKIERTQRNRDAITAERDQKKAELDALYSELVANPNNAIDISRRIKDVRDEMASIANANKEIVAKYDARLEKLKKEKENVLSFEQIEHMKELRSELEGLNPQTDGRRILAIATELKKIEDTTTLDVNSIRLDERRLAELLSSKAALENRKALLSKDMNVELLTIQHYLNPSNTITDSQQPDQQTTDDQTKTNTDTDSSTTGNDNKTDDQDKDDDDLDLDKLMANGIPVKPLTDEERKANLKAALANDTMNNDWLERAENENVYWEQKDKEEAPKEEAPKKNRLKVAGFAAAGAALKNKAKGMLGKFKEKLASMKENFPKEWKKYVAALIVAGITILTAIDLSDGKLIDGSGDTVQEQDADANTPEQDVPEQTVDETTPEEITGEEVANTEDEDDKENENDKDGKTGEQTAEQTQTAPVGPAPIIGDAAALGPDGIQYDPSGLDLTIPVIPVNPSDQHIISQESHVISENPEQHIISSTTTTTGGEELYTKTEEENHEVKVDDQGNITESTNTSSSSNGSSSSSGNGDVQSVTEEVIEDHVVLPDLGNTETTETIVTEQPSTQPSSEPTPADPTQEAPEIANGQLGTFALGSNETYVAPLSEAYFENANLAADNNNYNVTAQDDGTFTVTNTGDEDIQIAAQQREETNNTIDNSDIAADLAALEAELGVGLSIDTPENNSITR